MSNVNFQFIAEFLNVKPPTSPPVNNFNIDFDPSGLGEETHFSLLWLLPGVLLTLSALGVYLTAYQQKHKSNLKATGQADKLMF